MSIKKCIHKWVKYEIASVNCITLRLCAKCNENYLSLVTSSLKAFATLDLDLCFLVVDGAGAAARQTFIDSNLVLNLSNVTVEPWWRKIESLRFEVSLLHTQTNNSFVHLLNEKKLPKKFACRWQVVDDLEKKRCLLLKRKAHSCHELGPKWSFWKELARVVRRVQNRRREDARSWSKLGPVIFHGHLSVL